MTNLPARRLPHQKIRVPERDAIIRRLASEIMERGETRASELAKCVGLAPRSVRPWIARAHAFISLATDATPAAARSKIVNRYDKLYREALDRYEACKQAGDNRNAIAAIVAATAVVAGEAKARGIDQLPASSGDRPTTRLVFESYDHITPPSVVAALARLQAPPSAESVPRLSISHEDSGSGGPLR